MYCFQALDTNKKNKKKQKQKKWKLALESKVS